MESNDKEEIGDNIIFIDYGNNTSIMLFFTPLL